MLLDCFVISVRLQQLSVCRTEVKTIRLRQGVCCGHSCSKLHQRGTRRALFSPDGYGEVGDWVLGDAFKEFEWKTPVTVIPVCAGWPVVAGGDDAVRFS